MNRFVNRDGLMLKVVAFKPMVVLVGLLCLAMPSFAAGEKYRQFVVPVADKIYAELIAGGVCGNFDECNRKEIVFGEYGDLVNINIYSVTDVGIREKIAVLVVREGLVLTNGAGLRVSFFDKPKDHYKGIVSFFKEPNLTLEVK